MLWLKKLLPRLENVGQIFTLFLHVSLFLSLCSSRLGTHSRELCQTRRRRCKGGWGKDQTPPSSGSFVFYRHFIMCGNGMVSFPHRKSSLPPGGVNRRCWTCLGTSPRWTPTTSPCAAGWGKGRGGFSLVRIVIYSALSLSDLIHTRSPARPSLPTPLQPLPWHWPFRRPLWTSTQGSWIQRRSCTNQQTSAWSHQDRRGKVMPGKSSIRGYCYF